MKREKVSSYIKSLGDENFSINIFDLNHITRIAYGISIEMCLIDKNTVIKFTVNNKLTENDIFELQSAKSNERLEATNYKIVLNDLCKKGYLKPGVYQIEAFW